MPSSRTRKRSTTRKSNRKPKTVQLYETHDNGGRPFLVEIKRNKILNVYKQEYREEYNKFKKGEKILSINYDKIFIGDNDLKDNNYIKKGKLSRGNTILAKIGNEYIFIGGDTIYSFVLYDDEIVDYYSPIGNSDVPYPYAVGVYRTYFMLDKVSLPNSILDLNKDGYSQYFDITDIAEYKKLINRFKNVDVLFVYKY